MNAFVSPPRNRLSQTFQHQQQHQQQQPTQDPRSNLSRRFTTDSGRVPTLSTNIAGPRGPEEYQVRCYVRRVCGCTLPKSMRGREARTAMLGRDWLFDRPLRILIFLNWAFG